jgi:hypothetical protein
MSKRIEITFEIERRLVIKRKSGRSKQQFCELCLQETEMLTTDEAALIIGCGSRAIFGWVELEWLHFTETSEGLLLICSNSLSQILTINK